MFASCMSLRLRRLLSCSPGPGRKKYWEVLARAQPCQPGHVCTQSCSLPSLSPSYSYAACRCAVPLFRSGLSLQSLLLQVSSLSTGFWSKTANCSDVPHILCPHPPSLVSGCPRAMLSSLPIQTAIVSNGSTMLSHQIRHSITCLANH